MEIVILPEIEKRLFPLRPEEYQALRASIEREGVREPLVVWPQDGKLVLVDGHHRYRIARELGREFAFVERQFADMEEVLDWVDHNQLGRRNLTDEQRALLLGRMYERQKKNRYLNLRQFPKAQNELSEREGSNATAKAIATTAGVSQATVRRAAEFAKAVEQLEEVNPQAAKAVLEGMTRDAITALPKAVKEGPEVLAAVARGIASAKEGQKKVAIAEVLRSAKKEKQAAAAAREETGTAGPPEPAYTLFCCDIQDLAGRIEPGSADAIITDPPYSREHLPLYEALAALARHALKPGGSLFVMTGQSYLPDIFQILSRNLAYHWTLAYLTPGGQAPQIWPRRVNTFWKPVLWFVKEAYSGPWVGDVVRSRVNDNDKRFHEWGQSVSGMLDLIRRVTSPGDAVLDPFMGAGTTGVAALLLARRFIGADVDPEAVRAAEPRLKEAAHAAGEAGADRLAR